MRKIISVIAALSLLATVAIGGTVAYLTDTEERVNVLTTGKVDIELIEQERVVDENGNLTTDLQDFSDYKQLMPIVGSAQGEKDNLGLPIDAKNYVDKIVRVKNLGPNEAYLRVYIAVPAALEETGDSSGPLHWNIGNRFDPNGNGAWNDKNTAWKVEGNPFYDQFGTNYSYAYTDMIDGEEYNIYTFDYNGPLPVHEGEDMTTAIITGFYLDKNVNYDDEEDTWYFINENGEEENINYDLNREIYIPVMAVAVQVEGFDGIEHAFTEAGYDNDDDKTNGNCYNPWKDGLNDVVVNNQEELNAAIESSGGSTIVLYPYEGVYEIPGSGDFRGASNATINVKIMGTATDLHLENAKVSGATQVSVIADQGVYFRNVEFDSLSVQNKGGEFAADKCYIRNLSAEADNGFETKYSQSTFAGTFTVGQDKGAHNFYDCLIEKDVNLTPYLIANTDGEHTWYDDKPDDGVFFHGTGWEDHTF